jgi:hypothetical protein
MTLFATKLEIQEGFKGAANWKNKVPTIYYFNMWDNICHESCEFNKMSRVFDEVKIIVIYSSVRKYSSEMLVLIH